MAYDFHAIVHAAIWGLPEEKKEQVQLGVQLGLSDAALFAIQEPLRSNPSYVGTASRLEPICDQKLAELRSMSRDAQAPQEATQVEGELHGKPPCGIPTQK